MDWIHGKFDTTSGPVDACDAAIKIRLIPVAVVVGMSALALIAFQPRKAFCMCACCRQLPLAGLDILHGRAIFDGS